MATVKPIRSGELRQRVQLYDVPEATRDSYGQPSLAATPIPGPGLDSSFAADVEPLQGAERLNVRQIWPTATHLVRMRWLGSAIPAGPNNPLGLILPRMYLIDLSDFSTLNVLYARNVDKRNRAWELTCEEKVLT